MTVHSVILNPFCLSENRVRRDNVQPTTMFPNQNGGISIQERIDFMQQYTVENQNSFYLFDKEAFGSMVSEANVANCNKVTSHDQPVFLNRNLRKMKQIRKQMKMTQSNGLVTYMVPLLQ